MSDIGLDSLRAMANFGLTGLATMGANLARNIARNGFEIVVHNRTTARLEEFLAEHGDEGPIEGAASLEELVRSSSARARSW